MRRSSAEDFGVWANAAAANRKRQSAVRIEFLIL
jgi:hypothetical protein